MISKVCLGSLLMSSLFMSSNFCKSLENNQALPSTPAEISDEIQKWSNLVNQLKEQKDLSYLLLFAYQIHKFEGDNKQTIEGDEKLKQEFSSLKENIPERLKSLIWGTKCTIRNAQDKDAYLKIVKPSGKNQPLNLEFGNGIKTYWKFLPTIEKESGREDILLFTIQTFDNSDNLLGVKYIEKPNSEETEEENENGILEIINARQTGPRQMIKWNLKPFIGTSGPSKGEVVYWMLAANGHPEDHSKLYLDESLEVASNSRSPWVFECVTMN